jgi:two-component system, NtrC family, response regulator HydG
MTPTLVAIAGPSDGAVLVLDRSEISVGRDESNDLVLADESVAPRQCVFVSTNSDITVRDLEPSSPTFVNGLPASERVLAAGDRIRIGSSTFVVTFEHTSADEVQVSEESSEPQTVLVMRREEVLDSASSSGAVSPERRERDLEGLMRVSAAISTVHGLVALERPLIELVVDLLPADRGAVVLCGGDAGEVSSAVGSDRKTGSVRALQLCRPVVDRVLRETVGVVTKGAPSGGSILAAPLVAFDQVLGVIYLESDSKEQVFDEGHLRLLMSIASVAATALAYERQTESLADENRRLQAELEVEHHIIGDSPVMKGLYRQIARVASSDSTVLITGESGTGKELVARAIHGNSRRADRPFVAINCAAITETLLESELFGHEKGAFTGAFAQKKGKLETAEGGTVLLDEVGELSLVLQAKLLRVLQEREFERVGGTRPISVNFRLLAATNSDLEQAIEAKTFRSDLYYRLNVVSVVVPPLRERASDIPVLANDFVRRHAAKAERRITGVSAHALACMMAYDWPGNVRELENAIERAMVLGSTEIIQPDDLPEAVVDAAPAATSGRIMTSGSSLHFHAAITQAKKDLIVKAFDSAGGSYSTTARLLGLHPNYVHRLIRNLNLKALLKKSPLPTDRSGSGSN